MKRRLMRLLAFILCLVLLPCVSHAEELTLAEFTLENAKKLIAEYEWEGVIGSIDQVDVKLWRISSMERMELTQKLTDNGYLAAFLSEDFRLVVILQDYGLDLTEYSAAIEEIGCENIRKEIVNGRKFVIYDETAQVDSRCRIAAAEEANGQILEFVFFYRNELQDTLADVIIATIQKSKPYKVASENSSTVEQRPFYASAFA